MISIRTKLVATFLVISIFVGIMVIAVYITGKNVANSFHEINDESVPRINALHQMKIDSLVIYSRSVESTIEDNREELPEYIDDIEGAGNDFTAAYNTYAHALPIGRSIGPDRTIMEDWNPLKSNSDKLLLLMQETPADNGEIHEAREDLELSQQQFETTVNKILDSELEHNELLKRSVDDMERSLFALILTVLASSVMFAAGLGSLVSFKISKPLMQLKNSVVELAKGNYEAKIMNMSHDEIGDLAAHFEKMKVELREKDKMQNEFIMVASHELRTPIQPILGFAELALKGKFATSEALKKILEEARRLKRLADDILDVTQIEGGMMRYKMEELDLEELLEAVIESFSPLVTEGVSIATDIPSDQFIIGDEERLRQAFSNILDNAIKFTKAGKITVSCSKLNSDKLEIKISNEGNGIPPEVLPRLFTRFVTKDVNGMNRHGTGLGLFITKAIIEGHGGEIKAENNGQEATFIITFRAIAEKSKTLAAQ
jgi:signal transduction histidine kinase